MNCASMYKHKTQRKSGLIWKHFRFIQGQSQYTNINNRIGEKAIEFKHVDELEIAKKKQKVLRSVNIANIMELSSMQPQIGQIFKHLTCYIFSTIIYSNV